MTRKAILFTPESLAPAIAEGSKGFADQEQWVSKLLGSFAAIVRHRPMAYRSFGPFWWPLKGLMIEAGEFQGEAPDPAEVARVTLGSAALDMAAAWAFAEWSTSNMIEMNNLITVDDEDGDTYEYELRDDEMEIGRG